MQQPPRRRVSFAVSAPLLLLLLAVGGLFACGSQPEPPRAPCFTIHGDAELRAQNAAKTLEDLSQHIQLSPEDEALRHPKSVEDIKAILRRDVVYLFGNAATFARTLNTLEGRFGEASLELFLGESQLVASQVLSAQAAWVGGDLRIARANLASEGSDASGPTTDRGRMLGQLIRVVEEGNKIADALGAVAPSHLARGAEVIRALRTEAPTDRRTYVLVAEYHRLRGEWAEFDDAMKAAEGVDRASPALRYLRGMEQLERYRRPDLGADLMRECLAAFPKFVRPQAALVLMAPSPQVALRELAKLKEMNQDHYLVMLLEPTLAADHELTRMQNAAVGHATR
jgi:hypothetical protein